MSVTLMLTISMITEKPMRMSTEFNTGAASVGNTLTEPIPDVNR
jgi:hypothetical protein